MPGDVFCAEVARNTQIVSEIYTAAARYYPLSVPPISDGQLTVVLLASGAWMYLPPPAIAPIVQH